MGQISSPAAGLSPFHRLQLEEGEDTQAFLNVTWYNNGRKNINTSVPSSESCDWCFYAANVGVIAQPFLSVTLYYKSSFPPHSPHFRDEVLKLNYNGIEDVIQDVITIIAVDNEWENNGGYLTLCFDAPFTPRRTFLSY